MRYLDVRRILLHLAVVNPSKELVDGLLVLFELGEARLVQHLRCECRVPQLRAVRPAHEHALWRLPEEVAHRLDVALEGAAVGAFLDPGAQHVHGLRDGPDRLRVGVAVFHLHKLVRLPDPRISHKGRAHVLLPRAECDVHGVEHARVRAVQIDLSDLVAAGWPVYGGVRLRVEFLREIPGQGYEGDPVYKAYLRTSRIDLVRSERGTLNWRPYR